MANSENPIRKVFRLTLARLHEQTQIKMISKVPTILSQAIFQSCLSLSSVQIPLCQNNILTIPGRSHSFFSAPHLKRCCSRPLEIPLLPNHVFS